MSEYLAVILWERAEAVFSDGRYGRRHFWRFDGGVEVVASSSPHVVPVPFSETAAVDPEEAFVASLSSCHMLWFLSIACRQGFVVESYVDHARGVMGKNSGGKLAMIQVTLRPAVTFAGDSRPSWDVYEQMHHEAHRECFIANSVKTDVLCEPEMS